MHLSLRNGNIFFYLVNPSLFHSKCIALKWKCHRVFFFFFFFFFFFTTFVKNDEIRPSPSYKIIIEQREKSTQF